MIASAPHLGNSVRMDHEEAVALFESLTNASRHVAEHVLEAHGGDVNSAVEWDLESGGVGHGVHPGGGALHASPPDFVEEPDEEEELPQARSRPASGPLPAAARPRSSPIEVRKLIRPGRRVGGRTRAGRGRSSSILPRSFAALMCFTCLRRLC